MDFISSIPMRLVAAFLLFSAFLVCVVTAAESKHTSIRLEDKTLRILPLGASITYGLRSSTGNGYRLDLQNLLQPATPVTFIGSVKAGTMKDNHNEGHPGAIISKVMEYSTLVLPEKPNVVLIFAGTNDMINDIDLKNAPARMGTLIDRVAKTYSDAMIVVGQLVGNRNSTWAKRIEAYNKVLPSVIDARRKTGVKVLLTDFHKPIELKTDFSDDGTHPNDKGYAKMAGIWYTAIEKGDANGWITDPAKAMSKKNADAALEKENRENEIAVSLSDSSVVHEITAHGRSFLTESTASPSKKESSWKASLASKAPESKAKTTIHGPAVHTYISSAKASSTNSSPGKAASVKLTTAHGPVVTCTSSKFCTSKKKSSAAKTSTYSSVVHSEHTIAKSSHFQLSSAESATTHSRAILFASSETLGKAFPAKATIAKAYSTTRCSLMCQKASYAQPSSTKISKTQITTAHCPIVHTKPASAKASDARVSSEIITSHNPSIQKMSLHLKPLLVSLPYQAHLNPHRSKRPPPRISPSPHPPTRNHSSPLSAPPP